jgi:hypothetical protein
MQMMLATALGAGPVCRSKTGADAGPVMAAVIGPMVAAIIGL